MTPSTAIPVSLVKEVLPRLLTGSVVHGWIGVVTAPLSAGGAAGRKLGRGLVEMAIAKNSPIYRAGLLPGDIVTGVVDDSSLKLQDFYRHIRRSASGAVVRLNTWRNQERLVVPVESAAGRIRTPGHRREEGNM